mmetsp:Transcript_6740/g.25312  ORF Transcript_6740/g.25312 Transcript_6740/m.25312 type:complete len:245 (+) Transcript_6740:8655-9389(+)
MQVREGASHFCQLIEAIAFKHAVQLQAQVLELDHHYADRFRSQTTADHVCGRLTLRKSNGWIQHLVSVGFWCELLETSPESDDVRFLGMENVNERMALLQAADHPLQDRLHVFLLRAFFDVTEMTTELFLHIVQRHAVSLRQHVGVSEEEAESKPVLLEVIDEGTHQLYQRSNSSAPVVEKRSAIYQHDEAKPSAALRNFGERERGGNIHFHTCRVFKSGRIQVDNALAHGLGVPHEVFYALGL